LAVTAGSPFWALFRRHLQEKLGDPMDPATYAAWCYATSPDQLGLVLEQAAHVKPTVGKRNPAPDPWNDPRFWIVVDWAMAWGREAEFKALAEALPEGPAREAFQQIQARAGGLRGFFGFTVPHASGANEASGDAPVRPMEFKNMKVKTAPPAPDYPPEALGRRLMTTVHLALTVSAEGEPLGARLQPGPWLALFGPTAYAYALDWRFEPATVNREPQAARFILTMPFKLKEN
jgi:outer membrane biosynthesis protein TonB